VWAHASQLNFKVPSNGSLYNIIYGISDVQRAVSEKPLLRCLECLAEFTSTTKLYKHQFYVHRYRKTIDHSIVCHICEKQVDMVNAEKHADRHGEFEMVYFLLASIQYRMIKKQNIHLAKVLIYVLLISL
jgi:hypothetical protein